jgi:hypothetical protein
MSTISKADIPEAVLAKANNNPEGIRGFVYEGKAYIVADNIPTEWSEQQVRGLVMHEVGVHLRKVKGLIKGADKDLKYCKHSAQNKSEHYEQTKLSRSANSESVLQSGDDVKTWEKARDEWHQDSHPMTKNDEMVYGQIEKALEGKEIMQGILLRHVYFF